MVKLGIYAFSNDSGLGNQYKRLIYMIKPYRILAIDSSGFSKNKSQHWDWYDNFSGYKIKGFPTNRDVRVFLKDLTHVLVCENPLNFSLYSEAERMGIKVFCQTNYEFCDNLNRPNLALPYKFLMPSHWMIDDMKSRFGQDRTLYLPPPINQGEFSEARKINFERKGKIRLLHIVGTMAYNDRNGTKDVLEALKYTNAEFDLVIKSQHQLPDDYFVQDHRVSYQMENVVDPQDLYKDFDAVILPRKFGGLCLVTNEALMSGLPVFMTDVSPNNQLLPKEWLIKAAKVGEFKTRLVTELYESTPRDIAKKIDWIVGADFDKLKAEAFDLGHSNFSDTVLKEEYDKLWSL